VVLDAAAITADGTRRSIEVPFEVPATACTAQVNAWVVD
jgi:hypothetical protein